MRVSVITISDSVSTGKSEDLSGPAVAARCKELGIAAYLIKPVLQADLLDALLQVLSAVTVAGSAAVDNAAAGIHVFGGMGYTFDNDMHLYLKRAHVFRHLFGEPTDVLAELLAQDRAQ